MTHIDVESAAQRHWDRWLPDRVDITARNALVELYLPLVDDAVDGFTRRRSWAPADDLRQAAALNLVKLVNRYNPDLGPFENYLRNGITNAIREHLRRHGDGTRATRQAHRRARAHIDETVHAGVRLSAEDVAAAAKVSVPVAQAELDAVYGAARSGGNTSTDTGDMADSRTPDPSALYDVTEVAHMVAASLTALPVEYQAVLAARHADDRTMTEMAGVYGCSVSTASNMIDRATAALRRQLSGQPMSVSVPPAYTARVRMVGRPPVAWEARLMVDVRLLGAIVRDLVRHSTAAAGPGRRGNRAVPSVASGLAEWARIAAVTPSTADTGAEPQVEVVGPPSGHTAALTATG